MDEYKCYVKIIKSILKYSKNEKNDIIFIKNTYLFYYILIKNKKSIFE